MDPFRIPWSYKTPWQQSPLSLVTINETEHVWMARSFKPPVYLPAEEIARRRVYEICQAADGKDTVEAICDAVFSYINSHTKNIPTKETGLWPWDMWCHMDKGTSSGAGTLDCDDEVELAVQALGLLGINAHRKIGYPDSGYEGTPDYDPNPLDFAEPVPTRSHNGHTDILAFEADNGWNNYEGYIEVDDYPGPKKIFTLFPYSGPFADLHEMFQTVVGTFDWYWWNPDPDTGGAENHGSVSVP
jgi:hypothetical protein